MQLPLTFDPHIGTGNIPQKMKNLTKRKKNLSENVGGGMDRLHDVMCAE